MEEMMKTMKTTTTTTMSICLYLFKCSVSTNNRAHLMMLMICSDAVCCILYYVL